MCGASVSKHVAHCCNKVDLMQSESQNSHVTLHMRGLLSCMSKYPYLLSPHCMLDALDTVSKGDSAVFPRVSETIANLTEYLNHSKPKKGAWESRYILVSTSIY